MAIGDVVLEWVENTMMTVRVVEVEGGYQGKIFGLGGGVETEIFPTPDEAALAAKEWCESRVREGF
jgi:hypothetical protein